MSTDYTLAYGTHATPDEGRCAMEWVSYIAGEPHSDEPGVRQPRRARVLHDVQRQPR